LLKKLFLHIGAPKTGTTYIQCWLNQNRETLIHAGIWIPADDMYPHRLAAEFISDTERAARSDVVFIKQTPLEAVTADLTAARYAPGPATGIISSEYFFECRPRDVARIRDLTGGIEISIIIFIRRQDRILESGYNQEVKAMGVSETLEPEYLEQFNWLHAYESWADVFGSANVTVINYDTVAKSSQLLAEFCRTIGVPETVLHATKTDIAEGENRSLPANLLEFKRLANMFHQPGLDEWLFRLLDAGMPAPPFRLAPEIARHYLELYADSNRDLARRLYPDSQTELFNDSDLSGVPTGMDLTNQLPVETVAQILMFFMRETEHRYHSLLNRIKRMESEISQLRK
jgi:hypothetical protein